MGQVTIYLDDELIRKMRDAASYTGVSQSQWVADIIKKKLQMEWPDSFKALAGQWADLPSAEDLRASSGSDIKRETF